MAETPKVRNIAAREVLKDLSQAGIAAEPLLKEAGLQMQQINRDGGWSEGRVSS